MIFTGQWRRIIDTIKKTYALYTCPSVQTLIYLVFMEFPRNSYCLRKMTLRAYSNFLEMEDNLYAHPFYVEAATKAIEMYIELDSEPKEAEKLKNEEEMIASMSVNERKKYRAKQRKLKKQVGLGERVQNRANEKTVGRAALTRIRLPWSVNSKQTWQQRTSQATRATSPPRRRTQAEARNPILGTSTAMELS